MIHTKKDKRKKFVARLINKTSIINFVLMVAFSSLLFFDFSIETIVILGFIYSNIKR